MNKSTEVYMTLVSHTWSSTIVPGLSDAFLYKWKQAAIDSRKTHTTFGPADFAVLERLKRNSIS